MVEKIVDNYKDVFKRANGETTEERDTNSRGRDEATDTADCASETSPLALQKSEIKIGRGEGTLKVLAMHQEGHQGTAQEQPNLHRDFDAQNSLGSKWMKFCVSSLQKAKAKT